MNDNIEAVVMDLMLEYGLAYRFAVNLEGAMRNAVQDGLTEADATKFVRDILDNYELTT
jgi:hypothetical protein